MITREDLQAAIAECEGTRHPTASTCLKLAAFYTILNQMNGEEPVLEPARYSYASEPAIEYGNSEFGRLVKEKGMARCFPVLDEMMSAMLVVDPKLYQSTLRKLRSI